MHSTNHVGLDVELDSAARRRARRSEVYHALDFLRTVSGRRRQRMCQRAPRGAFVSVVTGADGVGFAGLQSCGSVTCPRCGPMVAAGRREELELMLARARDAGWTALFGTFTLRHHVGQSGADVLAGLSGAWRRLRSGRQWLELKRRYRIKGYTRVWETKYSEATGWHLHCHVLFFTDERPADHELEELLVGLHGPWARGARAAGLGSPLLRGQHLRVVVGDDFPSELGEYLTKDGSMAYEMTGGEYKLGASRTPGQLLRAAVDGDADALETWLEYEEFMRGRRMVAMSRGLRAELGMLDLEDEDLVADVEPCVYELTMPRGEWKRLRAIPGAVPILLETVETLGADTALWWLETLDVRAWRGAPPEDPAPLDVPVTASPPLVIPLSVLAL